MRKLLLAAALIAAASQASAADLTKPPVAPVFLKAPANAGCTVTSCVGAFVGGSLSQAGGNFDIIGTGVTGLAQNDFALGGQVGFEFFRSNVYAAILGHAEGDASLNAVPGTRFTNKLTWGVCGRLGYSLAGIFGAATTSGATPTLPQEFLSSLMTPYANVCFDERHNQPAEAFGAGVEALLAANAQGRSAWTLNIDYLHYNYGQGGTAGTMAAGPVIMPIAQTTDNLIKASINYHLGMN